MIFMVWVIMVLMMMIMVMVTLIMAFAIIRFSPLTISSVVQNIPFLVLVHSHHYFNCSESFPVPVDDYCSTISKAFCKLFKTSLFSHLCILPLFQVFRMFIWYMIIAPQFQRRFANCSKHPFSRTCAFLPLFQLFRKFSCTSR